MNSNIINGKQLSNCIKNKIIKRIKDLNSLGIIPYVTIFIIGKNISSIIYIKNKLNYFKNVGVNFIIKSYPDYIDEFFFLNCITEINKDKNIHGLIIQLPLPIKINKNKINKIIINKKDVDGFCVTNLGLIMINHPYFYPCTPYGIIKILESQNIIINRSDIVIIGSSIIVGKPLSILLLSKGATVTLCNYTTKDLSVYTKIADIVIVATGCPYTINAKMIKLNSVIIDVGINRNINGKIYGDVEFNNVSKIASFTTTVPGGVGPVTISMLLVNTIIAIEKMLFEKN